MLHQPPKATVNLELIMITYAHYSREEKKQS